MWLLTDRCRLPFLPHGFAQSKMCICSSFRCGAPSSVIVPQRDRLLPRFRHVCSPSGAAYQRMDRSAFLGECQDFGVELFTQCPVVEHETDVECAQGAFDFINSTLPNPFPIACVVDHRRIADCSVTHSIGYDFFDLCAAVPQFCQCGWDRTVDDLEIPTPQVF